MVARVLLVAVLAAACSSSSEDAAGPSTTGAPPAPSTTELSTSTTSEVPPTTVGDPDRCRSSQLRASLLPREGAAGTSFVPIELRNASGTACTMAGYARVALQDRSGRPVVGDPASAPDLPPAATGDPVRLEPGKAAQVMVAFSNIEPPDGPPCPTVSKIAVIPPQETDPLVVGVAELMVPCGNERVGPVTPPQPS